jgi:hypothetical protein
MVDVAGSYDRRVTMTAEIHDAALRNGLVYVVRKVQSMHEIEFAMMGLNSSIEGGKHPRRK